MAQSVGRRPSNRARVGASARQLSPARAIRDARCTGRRQPRRPSVRPRVGPRARCAGDLAPRLPPTEKRRGRTRARTSRAPRTGCGRTCAPARWALDSLQRNRRGRSVRAARFDRAPVDPAGSAHGTVGGHRTAGVAKGRPGGASGDRPAPGGMRRHDAADDRTDRAGDDARRRRRDPRGARPLRTRLRHVALRPIDGGARGPAPRRRAGRRPVGSGPARAAPTRPRRVPRGRRGRRRDLAGGPDRCRVPGFGRCHRHLHGRRPARTYDLRRGGHRRCGRRCRGG